MLRQEFKNQTDLLFVVSVLAFAWSLGLAVSTGVKATSQLASLLQFSTAEVAAVEEPVAQSEKVAKVAAEPKANPQPAAEVFLDSPAKNNGQDTTGAKPAVNGTGSVTGKPKSTPAAPAVVAPARSIKPATDPVYKANGVIPGVGDCSRPFWIGGTIKEGKSGNPISGVRVSVAWKKYYADRTSGSYGEGSTSVKTNFEGSWKAETPFVNASYHLTEFSAVVVSEDGAKQFSPVVVFSLTGSCRNAASATIDFVKQ